MPGGESNYVHFGYENTFKTAATTITKVFGENVTIRNVDLKNNLKRLSRLSTRNTVEVVANKFEGALSLEFDLSDPWFMKGVLGAVQTSAATGTSSWIHTFTEANVPPSLTINNGISGIVRQYLGCIIGDCKISTAVGDEPAKVSLTVMYADEVITSSAITSQTAPIDGVYPFSYGSFEYPTGTSIADTESVELTIANTAAMKWGLGSRKASRYDMRNRVYDVTTTNFFDDPATYLRKAYANGTSSTPNTLMISGESGCTITLDNGQSNSAARKWSFVFTRATIERHSLGTQAVEDEQMETIDIIPQSLIIQCTNMTSGMVS